MRSAGGSHEGVGMKRIAFRNARLIDPASGLDAKGGLLIENGRIADVGPRLFNDGEPNDPEVIDCRGLVLAPGLIDCRVFTGEPGAEHRESLESASAAAAVGRVRGGVGFGPRSARGGAGASGPPRGRGG